MSVSATLTPAAQPGSDVARRSPRRPRTWRDRWTVARLVRLLVLLLFAGYFGLPLVWLVLAPTRTDSEIGDGSPFAFGSFVNVGHAWSHLMKFDQEILLRWALNSLEYTAATLILTLATSLLAGYALAVLPVPGRRLILVSTLIAMIMPVTALVLPLYLEISALHLNDTALSVILPSSFFPFGVYLAYVFYSTTLPTEIMDAARMDGCGEWQLFTRIALPLSKSLVSLVAFFSFVANWNSYFLPYVMLSDDNKYTLPVGLGVLVANSPGINPALGGSELPIRRPEVALAGLLVVLPVALIFIGAQRFLVRGSLLGAVKT